MGIINLDWMQATHAGPLRSMKFAAADVLNGSVVIDTGLVTGETELRTAAAPTDVLTQTVWLVTTPEVMYEEYKGLKDFTNVAGKAFRTHALFVGDIFTLTDDLITGATTLGQFVIPVNATMKLAAAATLAGGTKLGLKVIEKGPLGYLESASTTVEVVKV